LLGRDFTEVGPLWQVPANETIGIFIRASLPGCVGAGEVASDPKFGREYFMLGILGPVVQRKSLTALGWELLESTNDCPDSLVSVLPGQLGDQDKSALAFDQRVECCLALSRDEAVALPVTVVSTALNGLRSGVDRNPVGNRGFSDFSADAFIPSFLVGSAQQLDHLQPVRVLGMIDVLIDRLVVNGVSWMVDPDPPGDLLRGPSLCKAVSYILPNEIVLQAFVLVCFRLSFASSGMCSAWNITPALRRTVSLELA